MNDSLPYDDAIRAIARYLTADSRFSEATYETAFLSLIDSIGCALLALNYPACTKLLGPVVPNTDVPMGSRVIGTSFVLDPIRAAFNHGIMIRWLDYNDTWLAAEWGHPSDNLGALLSLADYLDRTGQCRITIRDLLKWLIQAYEIQGVIALSNSFNQVGLDHVILVKVATAAVTTAMLQGSQEQVQAAISNAWIDSSPLRTYRHFPNTGSRKSWAAGDATSRGLQIAYWIIQGEMGYPTALTAKRWGFHDVIFRGKSIKLQQPLGSYVMDHILFKIAFPAEFHAQTAVEAAIDLHHQVNLPWSQLEKIEIHTQLPAIQIIDKKGELKNPADRDHCIQYMVALGLLHGKVDANDYEDEAAKDPMIDLLREKMQVIEKQTFTSDYLDPEKRSIANEVILYFKDGTSLKSCIEYPLGHKRRRKEAIPLIYDKLERNLKTRFNQEKIDELMTLFQSPQRIFEMPCSQFIELLTT